MENRSRSTSDIFVQPYATSSQASLLQEAHETLLTKEALQFINSLIQSFANDIEKLESQRLYRQWKIRRGQYVFDFLPEGVGIRSENWKIHSLPPCLYDRRVDLGDVDPSNASQLLSALQSEAQGVQIDFDDGFCPHWYNVLIGHYNVYKACRGYLSVEKEVSSSQISPSKTILSLPFSPYIMFRPRAFNMIERNIFVKGKRIPGSLFDFGLHIFHNGKILNSFTHGGPFFYLSKLEEWKEALLWNRIFNWTENKISLPFGSIKACVLIESLPAVFQMDEILWALKEHSAGLNCGMWDYAASFIARLGHKTNKLFPDRSKYVTMKQMFLAKYRSLLIATCHRRGAPATGGMFAGFSGMASKNFQKLKEEAEMAKGEDALCGADGGLVYDIILVPYVQQTFQRIFGNNKCNQIDTLSQYPSSLLICKEDLLTIPEGGATLEGLELNIEVSLHFIENWIKKRGHFILHQRVEDSATAEISRLQVWQQLLHGVPFEGKPLEGRFLRFDKPPSSVTLPLVWTEATYFIWKVETRMFLSTECVETKELDAIT
ncbi:putative Malate synthase, glyoxysomal [Cardiosporidium cionae]|uniref:malate synthase n=1 Tax=Cardiosporidium cionae TaxID=476202 RepID=A0ABQ7J8S7_9APIC|nr:putative Malate synthase, glyoxysomal [Cardiosporidium cionae]|eukprot:KAF8820401.1 putative Malate synthase, glyoxysomal [Cardiosporidium cionae]